MSTITLEDLKESTAPTVCIDSFSGLEMSDAVRDVDHVAPLGRAFGFMPDMDAYVSQTPYTTRKVALLPENKAIPFIRVAKPIKRIVSIMGICGLSLNFEYPIKVLPYSKLEVIHRSLKHSHMSSNVFTKYIGIQLVHEASHAHILELYKKAGYDNYSWSPIYDYY